MTSKSVGSANNQTYHQVTRTLHKTPVFGETTATCRFIHRFWTELLHCLSQVQNNNYNRAAFGLQRDWPAMVPCPPGPRRCPRRPHGVHTESTQRPQVVHTMTARPPALTPSHGAVLFKTHSRGPRKHSGRSLAK